MPPDFLMQQMEWREAAAEARAAARRRGARAAAPDHRPPAATDMLRLLGARSTPTRNYDAGCSLVRKLRFLEKLDQEIDDALESLHEEAR